MGGGGRDTAVSAGSRAASQVAGGWGQPVGQGRRRGRRGELTSHQPWDLGGRVECGVARRLAIGRHGCVGGGGAKLVDALGLGEDGAKWRGRKVGGATGGGGREEGCAREVDEGRLSVRPVAP